MRYFNIMLEISCYAVSLFAQNSRLLVCKDSNESVLVDPGGDAELLLDAIEKSGARLKQIWLTHSHLDHCGAVSQILQKHKVDLVAHMDESFMRSNVEAVAAMYGVPEGNFFNCPEPDIFVAEGDEVKVGRYVFKVLFTPGHSPGHVSFYNQENELIIAGDVLFAGSIGRTDLPGGDYEQLIRSVREKLFTLPAQTKVMSGHGPDTTIAKEIRDNPFFNGTL